MPIYEYRCENCGEKFEKLVSSSNAGTIECVECGSPNTKKLFSAFASSGESSFSGGGCSSSGSPFS